MRVSARGGGVCPGGRLPGGGVCPGGCVSDQGDVCLTRGVSARGVTDPSPVNRMTDRC